MGRQGPAAAEALVERVEARLDQLEASLKAPLEGRLDRIEALLTALADKQLPVKSMTATKTAKHQLLPSTMSAAMIEFNEEGVSSSWPVGQSNVGFLAQDNQNDDADHVESMDVRRSETFDVESAPAGVRGPDQGASRATWRSKLEDMTRQQWYINAVLLVNMLNVFCLIFITQRQCEAIFNSTGDGGPVGLEPWALRTQYTLLSLFVLDLVFIVGIRGWQAFTGSGAGWNIASFVIIGRASMILIAEQRISKFTPLLVFRTMRMCLFPRFMRESALFLNVVVWTVPQLVGVVTVLACTILAFGLPFVQMMLEHVAEVPQDRDVAVELFGSVPLGLLSVLQGMTGGQDWGEINGVLALAGTGSQIMFVALILFFQLSFFNIITGIFLNKALELATSSQSNSDLLADRMVQEKVTKIKMEQLLKEMNVEPDEDGIIDMQSLQEALQDKKFRSSLELFGFQIQNADIFFKTLLKVEGCERLTLDTFVEGCLGIKGPATNADVISLQLRLEGIAEVMDRLCDRFGMQGSVSRKPRGSHHAVALASSQPRQPLLAAGAGVIV